MNLKTRIALNLSMAFSVILGVVISLIYWSFYTFRKTEFQENLEHSSAITANYISRIPSEDFNDENKTMANINNNDDDFLIREKILVFDQNKNLIFSNTYNKKVEWDVSKINLLDKKDKIFWTVNDYENIGLKTIINGRAYYILTSAEDVNGNAKLNFLKAILTLIFTLSLLVIWIFSFYFMQKQLKPLDDFKDNIAEITAHKLTTQLPEKKSDNEINVLVKAFNTMMLRLNEAFLAQKEFTTSASHEIKTPLTRMSFQLENFLNLVVDEVSKNYIKSIQNEVYQLSDTVNSLLVLSKIEDGHDVHFENVRLDEVVFEAFANAKKNFKDFEIDFEINDQYQEGDLTIRGVKSLLEIVYINLFKNVCLYSFEPKAKVEILENKSSIIVRVISEGEILSREEKEKIFEAFRRGKNAQNIAGSGLGLRISKRIMDFHHGEIQYSSYGNKNIFTLVFSIE